MEQEDLFDKNTENILSQIQPHFLYNILTLIQYYCNTDPKIAEETVVEFSVYLRGNLDALILREKIKFERELRHVISYLSIEKKRFERKFNVSYDIKVIDFMLPPLTLMAIVENAVCHGITKKEDSGTIWIETCETDGNIVITISDDGAGFDVNEEAAGGIKNVRNRLAEMCGGTLEITSKPGIGTKAVITIPV